MCDRNVELPLGCGLFNGEEYCLRAEEAAGVKEGKMRRTGPAPETIELAERIRAYAKEKGIPYGQAYSQMAAKYPEDFKRAARAVMGLKIRPSEIGSGEFKRTIYDYTIDPDVEFRQEARRIAASENIPYRDALSEVAKRNPDLLRRYNRAVLYHDI